MDAGTERDGHGERVLDTLDGFGSDGMSHRATGTKIGISQTFRCQRHKDRAYHRIASRIPTGGDNTNGFVSYADRFQRAAEVPDLSVNIETIHRTDTACSKHGSELLYLARRRADKHYICVDAVQTVVMMIDAS